MTAIHPSKQDQKTASIMTTSAALLQQPASTTSTKSTTPVQICTLCPAVATIIRVCRWCYCYSVSACLKCGFGSALEKQHAEQEWKCGAAFFKQLYNGGFTNWERGYSPCETCHLTRYHIGNRKELNALHDTQKLRDPTGTFRPRFQCESQWSGMRAYNDHCGRCTDCCKSALEKRPKNKCNVANCNNLKGCCLCLSCETHCYQRNVCREQKS